MGLRSKQRMSVQISRVSLVYKTLVRRHFTVQHFIVRRFIVQCFILRDISSSATFHRPTFHHLVQYIFLSRNVSVNTFQSATFHLLCLFGCETRSSSMWVYNFREKRVSAHIARCFGCETRFTIIRSYMGFHMMIILNVVILVIVNIK